MATLSLYDHFTAIPDGHPPTELINDLLRIVAYDVCQLKRNTHTSYHTITRFRDLCKEINTLIKTASSATGEDWTSYDEYTAMIEPLEEALFKFAAVAEKESSRHLPDVDEITKCLNSIEDWKTNRKDLREIFDLLLAKPFTDRASVPETDIAWARYHDDLGLFSILQTDISEHPIRKSKLFPQSVARMLGAIETDFLTIQVKLQDRLQTDDTGTLSLQLAMAIYGIVEILHNTKTSREMTRHLASALVWSKLRSLSSNISAHVTQKTPALEQLEKEWAELTALLKKLSPSLPTEFFELRKKATSVRRPYYAQTTQLILECREVAHYFNTNPTDDNLKVLHIALKSAVQALEASIQAVTGNRAFSATTEVSKGAVTAFSTAQKDLETCFTTYKLDKWSEWADKMTAAQAKDADHLNKLMERTEKPRGAAGETTKISVRIAGIGPAIKPGKDYTVELSTSLDALLWKIRPDLEENIRNSLLRPYFGKPTAHGKYDALKFSDTVEGLAIEGGTRMAYLIVQAQQQSN